jgi:hypothetical protein
MYTPRAILAARPTNNPNWRSIGSSDTTLNWAKAFVGSKTAMLFFLPQFVVANVMIIILSLQALSKDRARQG